MPLAVEMVDLRTGTSKKDVSNLINGMKSKNHHKPLFCMYAIRFLTALSSLPSLKDLANNQVKFA